MLLVDVNIKGGHDEVTPLHLACRYDSGSATQTLLTRGADVNCRDLKGRTPLHYATRRGHATVTKVHNGHLFTAFPANS